MSKKKSAKSSRITILHLSDIHFRRPDKEKRPTYRQDVRDNLLEALSGHFEGGGVVPEVIAVTGDIAFSGKEYAEAKSFFKDLADVVPGKRKIPFLLVPGNHDVDRDEVSKRFSLYDLVKKSEVDEFLEDEGDVRKFLLPKFRAYRAFCDELCPGLYDGKEDYYWVKDIPGKEISFLGLNSSWGCEGDKDAGNITLGYPQVTDAFRQARQPYKIVLLHHPVQNWFNETDFSRYNGEIFKRCGLLLHGHTHNDNAAVYKTPGESYICLGANASYTYGGGKVGGFIGFQFVEAAFSSSGTEVTVWPYVLDERGGRKRFVQDTHRYDGQGNEPFFRLKTFEAEDTKAAAGKSRDFRPLDIPTHYKEWITAFFSTMDIDLLARKGEVITVGLPEVYIPIETANPFYKGEKEKHAMAGEPEDMEMDEAGDDFESKEPPTIDIETLVGRWPCLLLRGAAGTGKTTLLKHLAYTVTLNTCQEPLRNHLPVLVFLKDLWLVFQEILEGKPKKLEFEELLALYLKKVQCPLDVETISRFLERDRVLFLFDGLDEVPEELRKDLVDLIAGFRLRFGKNRFVFTGRAHGVSGPATAHFRRYLRDIEPLDREKAQTFIRKWFRAVSGAAAGVGEASASGLIADADAHEHLRVFMQNPLLLTAVCILYQDGKRIPEQRADLYFRIIDNLIHRRFHDPAQPGRETEVLEFLMLLAFSAQQKNRKTTGKNDSLAALEQVFSRGKEESELHYRRKILKLFGEIEPNCGVLNCLGSGDIEFSHLTFQEFLAARYMVYMKIDWRPFVEQGWWEETLLLYAGLLNLDRKRESNEVAQEMLTGKVKRKRKHRNHLHLLAARALCDFQANKREEAVVRLAREKMLEVIGSGASLEKRFQAGALLGTLGDPRLEKDNMALIPAGEFIMGDDDSKYEREKPQHTVYLDAYRIGVYPVTNLEFKRFVQNGGYRCEEFWDPNGWKWCVEGNISEPEYWHDRKWNGHNFPVMGISWYEADAYCKWLSHVTGEVYRLPTEAQWEKAARGTDGKEFPWGNGFDKKRCNSEESGLGRTSPVGIFPGGQSNYGCFDMAGNVWEWCADWFNEEYYKTSHSNNPQGPLDGDSRVMRGGSWGLDGWNVRSAVRLRDVPSYRWFGAGFRLARGQNKQGPGRPNR